MRKLAAALVAAALVIGIPAPARATDGLEFLDTRPVVIDLDRSAPGQRWRVPIIDGRAGGGRDVFLTLSFRPAGVLQVVTRRVSTGEGDVAEFVIELSRRLAGSGELILAGDGTVVRRPISTAFGAGRSAVPISHLQFTGVRLAPFTDRVRAGSLTVRDAPGGGGRSGDGRIGTLASNRGDTVEVVRDGTTFAVQGVTGVGAYQGSVDLVPGQPGGEATATLWVRDLPIWPLLVLVLGLLVMQFLDRYQNRGRPRRLFHLRLARLRDRGLATQRVTGLAFRVVAGPGEPGLLLDRLIADASARYDEQRSDADRGPWDVGGAEYQKIVDLVESVENLAQTFQALHADREQVDSKVARAFDTSRAAKILVGRLLRTPTDLADATTAASEARTYLDGLDRLHRTAVRLRDSSSGEVREGAERVLGKLSNAPESLAGIESEIEELQRRWQPKAAPEIPWPQVPPAHPGYPQPSAPPPAATRSRSRPLAGVLATVLILGSVAVLYSTLSGSGDPPAGVFPTSSPSPNPSPSISTPLPEVPASPAPVPPPALAIGPSEPTTTDLVVYGVVLPLILAGVLAVGVWIWWRRRRPASRPPLDTTSLDRKVRLADRQFALVGGVLVVLGGMSVLYAGNPTFGTGGDYLAIALWATAFGEGLSLARRLWPLPAGA